MGDIQGFLRYGRERKNKQAASQRLQHFKEFVEPWNEQQYHEQAARCMDCGVPFCHQGCPLGNKIPDFNDAVYRGQWKEAWEVLKSTNNFPEFTGRICPAPCEASCVLGLNNAAVNIEHIELEIAERAFQEGWEHAIVPSDDTGYRVAVVGSGPAGLAAAEELRKQGHSVTVFERDEAPGGLLRLGIPDFKLDKTVIDRRIELMQRAGIDFCCNTEIGNDISVTELEERFDAIVLCVGATVPRDLPIPGRSLSGVHFAMDFLSHQNRLISGKVDRISPELNAKNKKVLVIGGGDTGADCVGTSNRQGAFCVTQIELMEKPPEERTVTNPWPEWPMTLKTSSSHEEGVARDWSVLTKRFIGEDGKLTGVETIRIRWTDKAKFRYEEIPGSKEVIECDLAFLAIGFAHHEKSLSTLFGLELDPNGNVKTTGFKALKKTGETSRSMIFAAGDCRRGQSLVVWAIAEGRRAAMAVNNSLEKAALQA
ncbi:MAG: glutamate synthase subunit beta [Bacteroidota bacterium]|nr:glutamate synthase subunit beta [Bacteroidota bacterium]